MRRIMNSNVFIEFSDFIIESLDIKESIDDGIEKVSNYMDNPSAENTAELIQFAASQLAGHLIGAGLEKVFPNKGLDAVFKSIRAKVDLNTWKAGQNFKRAAYGYLIGKMIEFEIDKLQNSDWLYEHFFAPIFHFGEEVADFVSSSFISAQRFVPIVVDPLVLDLDGDGLETLGVNAGVLFDHDGDGIRTGTGWISPDDGFLALDRNGNGVVRDLRQATSGIFVMSRSA